MSTRCQIAFYDRRPRGEKSIMEKWEALVYRHSDGYPEGVMPELVPFLRRWMKVRGWDLEYCAARLLQDMCNRYDRGVRENGGR